MSETAKTETSEAIPAATVVVFRHGSEGEPPELLMVTRSKNMRFAGGAAVFPGGRVDPADFALAEATEHGLETDEAAHRIAAIRETIEETGLVIGISGEVDATRAAQSREMLLAHEDLAPVLEAMDWQLALDELVPFARWFPKNERLSRTFDTRFYLADLGTGAVDVAIDETENTRLFWSSAQGAIDADARGEISIIFPTRRNLERLAQFGDYAEARVHAESIPVKTIIPFMTEENGERWLRIADDAGYPVTGEPFTSVLRG